MKKRLLSMLLCLCMLISLVPAVPVLAAQGDLPSILYLAPSESSNLPSRIDLFPDPSASSSSNLYHLYLPGNVSVPDCFLSWEDGLSASYNGKTYASGQLPIPAPGESGEVTFTKGSQTKKFIITTYQGSAGVKPIFIEIDESQGTIAAMHGDSDHLTTCTGDIVIDGERMHLPQIKGRGNYSWMQRKTKYPYNFKLDTKVNLLGIDSPKTKKWTLLANVNDPSLLRNKVAYDLAHQMGIGLDSAHTDVWLNGVYQGTYLLTPKTDSFVPDDGFLIENNNWAEEQSIAEGGDPSFRLGDGTETVSAGGGGGGWPGGGGWGGGGWPGGGGGSSKPTLLINIKGIGDNWLEGGEETPETVTAAAKAIRAYLEDAWAAVLATDGKNDKGKYYTDYFDLRSTAIFYVFQEFIKNLESTSAGSIFFHRDGMTDADKLLSGPAWDYDNALAFNGNGGSSGSNYLSARGWYLSSGSGFGLMGSGGIFSRLAKHQDLMDETKIAYTIYRRFYDDVSENVLRQAELIEDSAIMNHIRDVGETMNAYDFKSARTFDAGTEYEITYKKTDTWRDYVDNLYAFTEGRARFLRSELLVADEPGYDATFQLGTNSSVTVYDTQDLSGEGVENPDIVYARNSATGEIDATGEGQINFVVNLKNGYQLKNIKVEPAENFKNLKGPADTGVENAYRITKVTGPVTITVETQEFACEHEFVDGVCVKCGAEAFRAVFDCDEHCSVTVYDTQDLTQAGTENAPFAYARSSASGAIDVTGEGQINFVVQPAHGYEIESVTATKGNYKNLKGPDETMSRGYYRLTKVTGPITVTVKTRVSTCEHDYKAEVTPPTCTEKGYTTYTCSKCGDSYKADEVAALGHNFVNGVCTRCGEQEAASGITATFACSEGASVSVYETQDLNGPHVDNAETAYPRDSATGQIDSSGNGQVNFVVVLQPGYVLESVTAAPASAYKNLKGPADTGVENGYRVTKVTGDFTVTVTARRSGDEPKPPKAYFVCDEGVSITTYETQDLQGAQENATEAFARDSVTGEIVTEGQVNFVVNVADGYKLESITAEPAANYKNFKLPDETLVPNGYRITKMTGDVTVTVKAVETECQHDYKAVVTPPTCTAQGFTTYTCSKCGDSYVGDYTAKIAHNYVGGVCTVCGEKLLNVTISCNEGASVTVFETQKPDGPSTANAAKANPRDGDSGLIDCSGEGQVNFQVILAEGYELESVTAEPASAYKNLKGPEDTGMVNGYRITKVKGDFTITVKAKKAACEHDYKAVVTPPTCTEKGYTTYTCSKCGDSYVADEKAALGHSFGQWTTTKAATCTAEGEQTRTCSRCGEKETRKTDALGHDYKAVVTAPTCTEKGYTTYTCSRCGDKYTGNEVAALGHDYKAVVTAPTCTAKGFTTYTCSRCGDKYTGNETAALGHDWGEGVVTTQPTENSTGIRTYTCSRCGEKRTEVIPELSHVHKYTAVVTPPTCTEAGFTTHTCTCGDSYVDTPVPALGHSFGEWAVTKTATCTGKGEETSTCSRCGEKQTRETDALGHDYKAVVTAPTCTEAGYTTYTCARCSDSYKGNEVEALGHEYKDGVCTRCGAADPDYVPPINKSALQAAIAAAEKLTLDKYTPESVAAFNKALDDAKAALEADTQAAVDKAAADLEAAVKALVEKPAFRFDDVQDSAQYYYKPVYWAVEQGITTGTSTTKFSPNAGCTRAQVVTFLWRAAGKPAPTETTNPFKDVAKGQYYYDAVLWAVEKEITNGTSKDTFDPEKTCTRAQIVTFLWRYAGKPAPTKTSNPFIDVPAGQYYTDAVLWAVEKEITKGTSKDKFSPNDTCTRAQIVTFLYRATPKEDA